MASFDILILAGGKSRRIGRDKAGILLAGQTLLGRVLAGAAAWGGKGIMVAGPPRDFCPAEYIPDPPGLPPSSLRGIYAGMLAAQSPWLLVTGCDMPFVQASLIERLWAAKNVGGAVAWWQNRRQPLPGFYPRSGQAAAAALLAEGRLHLAALLDCLQPAVVRDVGAVDPAGVSFFNLNTPDDLAQAKQWLADNTL